jgi:hypothetical protein
VTDEEEKLRAPAATALNLCAHPASPQGRGANIGKDLWVPKLEIDNENGAVCSRNRILATNSQKPGSSAESSFDTLQGRLQAQIFDRTVETRCHFFGSSCSCPAGGSSCGSASSESSTL